MLARADRAACGCGPGRALPLATHAGGCARRDADSMVGTKRGPLSIEQGDCAGGWRDVARGVVPAFLLAIGKTACDKLDRHLAYGGGVAEIGAFEAQAQAGNAERLGRARRGGRDHAARQADARLVPTGRRSISGGAGRRRAQHRAQRGRHARAPRVTAAAATARGSGASIAGRCDRPIGRGDRRRARPKWSRRPETAWGCVDELPGRQQLDSVPSTTPRRMPRADLRPDDRDDGGRGRAADASGRPLIVKRA